MVRLNVRKPRIHRLAHIVLHILQVGERDGDGNAGATLPAAFAGKGYPDSGYLPPPDYPPGSGPGGPYDGGDAFRSGDPRWK